MRHTSEQPRDWGDAQQHKYLVTGWVVCACIIAEAVKKTKRKKETLLRLGNKTKKRNTLLRLGNKTKTETLLRLGNFWIRTLLAIDIVVDVCLHVSFDECDPDDLEIVEFMTDHFFPSPWFRKKKLTQKVIDRDNANKEEYRCLATGDPWAWGVIHHKCGPGKACRCRSVTHTRNRFKSFLRKVAYSKRPEKPLLDEWTKAFKSLKFHIFGTTMGGVLMTVFEVASGNITPRVASEIKAQRDALDLRKSHHVAEGALSLHSVPVSSESRQNTQNTGKGLIQEFMEEMDWHKMVGKNIKKTRENLMNQKARFQLLLQSSLLLYQEHINTTYFKAEFRTREEGSRPPVFTMLWERKSPATTVLQFCGTLAFDHPDGPHHILAKSLK